MYGHGVFDTQRRTAYTTAALDARKVFTYLNIDQFSLIYWQTAADSCRMSTRARR